MRRRFFNNKNDIDFSLKYLSFTAKQDNSTISLNSTSPKPDLMYSLNGSDWAQWDYSAITVNIGDMLCLKGNNSTLGGVFNSNKFSITGKVNVEGNIMSLLYGDDFKDNTLISSAYTFRDLFKNCSIISAKNLILPATALAIQCYRGMFSSCTSLVTAPELPATTLTNGCYNSMFYGCTSLVTAPELPATTLNSSCYNSMFYGCTSLVTAPELPATTLAAQCYNDMFGGCTSLVTAPELPATTLAAQCYNWMFRNCSKLNYIKMLATDISATSCLNGWVNGVAGTGTFVKHPDMTSLPSGTSGIPSGWTVKDNV